MRRSYTSDSFNHHGTSRLTIGQHLPPIPGSPYATEGSEPSTPSSQKKTLPNTEDSPKPRSKDSPVGKTSPNGVSSSESSPRLRSKSSSYVSHRPPQPQSLSAAVEMLTSSQSESGDGLVRKQASESASSSRPHVTITPPLPTPSQEKGKRDVPPSPRRPIPALPNGTRTRNVSSPMFTAKEISAPILNHGKS